jgi:hypothetical protein
MMADLRARLSAVLANGLSGDALQHAEQVAQIAAVLHEAFERVGLRCTLVGGSAIEIHAPGVYTSGDIDVVIDAVRVTDLQLLIGDVFENLGFSRKGRHWVFGDLFVEVPSHDLTDPSEIVRVGTAVFRVVTKEVVLADRIVGFKQWEETGYGEQAVEMLAAFGLDLDMSWLEPRLRAEGSWDAFEALSEVVRGQAPVTAASLESLLRRLRGRDREP